MPVSERADDETAAEMPRFLRLWSASCFSSFAPARVSLRIIRCLSGAGFGVAFPHIPGSQ